MALTISQIYNASRAEFPTALNRPNYVFDTAFMLLSGNSYVAHIVDHSSNLSVPMVWSINDETQGTEIDRMNLLRALIRNGVNALDSLIFEQSRPDPSMEDVIFDA